MSLLTKRNVSLLFIGWACILLGSAIAKKWYSETMLPVIPNQEVYEEEYIEEPFPFDVPTEEELQSFRETATENNVLTIELIGPLAVHSCPQNTCRTLGAYSAGTTLYLDITNVRDTDEWVAVPWPNARRGPKKGYAAVEDLQRAALEAPPPPKQSIDPSAWEEKPIEPIAINPETLVGIVCEFAYEGDDANMPKTRTTRGSGALITDDGYILTAKSVVDLGYVNEGLEDYKRISCLVGQMPHKQPLPSLDQIKTINAFVRLPYLSYTADVAYAADPHNLSDYENAWLDFAILKINGVNPDARFFGGPTKVPTAFPVAPLLISSLPNIHDETLNFAFPSGTTAGQRTDIKTLFLQGLISHVTGYWAGDERYANDLFLVETFLDTEDTAGGRFGSPIFWKGYIIGVHTAKQQGTRQIYNVSTKAILENMFDSQFQLQLEVE